MSSEAKRWGLKQDVHHCHIDRVTAALCGRVSFAAGFIRQHVLKNVTRAIVITATLIPILGGNLSGMVMYPLWYHAWHRFFIFDPILGIIQIVLWTIGLSVVGNAFYFSGRKSNPQQHARQVSSEAAPSASPDEPSA